MDEWRCPACEQRGIRLDQIRSEKRSVHGVLLRWFEKMKGGPDSG